jgi:hypothetical protein
MLGTFLGIVLGLWEFDTHNIVDSVPFLLEGLKLAFITSIMGIGLSVFLSLAEARAEKSEKKDDPLSLLLSEIKRGLNRINQTLVTKLDNVEQQQENTNQTLVTKLDNVEQQQKNTNQSLAAILETVKQLKTDIYQRRYRFTKLGSDGQILPEEASQWVAVQDNESGLIWEIKTNDGGLQDSKQTFSWYDPNGKIVGEKNGGQCEGCRCDTAAYVEAINKMQLAGYKDWRVPSLDEFKSLVKDQSGVDRRYFPNLQPTWYYSSTPHPKKNNMLCYFSFESSRNSGGTGGQYLLLTRKIVK